EWSPPILARVPAEDRAAATASPEPWLEISHLPAADEACLPPSGRPAVAWRPDTRRRHASAHRGGSQALQTSTFRTPGKLAVQDRASRARTICPRGASNWQPAVQASDPQTLFGNGNRGLAPSQSPRPADSGDGRRRNCSARRGKYPS